MTGVIIAAGRGGRLNKVSGGIPKTLLPINGKPILQWIIDESVNVGVSRFVIVTGYNGEKIEEYFRDNLNVDVKLLFNPLWEKGNGISVLSAETEVIGEECFLLMMSDHLIEREIIRGILNMKKDQPALAVEENLSKVFDLEDATKVYIENKEIVSIGKELKQYNGIDAGLFLLNRTIFRFLKKAVGKGKDSLTEGIKEMIKEYRLFPFSIPRERFWIDVDSEESYSVAKQMWRQK